MSTGVEGNRPQFGGGDLARLQEFYLEMTRKGLVRKKGYDLPLLDTIGRPYQCTKPEPE